MNPQTATLTERYRVSNPPTPQDQQRALRAVLSSAKARNANDIPLMIRLLKSTDMTVAAISLRLLEATEVIAYLARLSGRSDEFLAALEDVAAGDN